MKLAGRVGWVGIVTSLGLLAAGGVALQRRGEDRVTPELRLVPSPADVELAWGAAPARPGDMRGRPDIAREQSTTLPPWFGLVASAPVRIAGRVSGGTGAMTIRLALDVPDPGIWTGREMAVSADGAFDFGPMRAGRYVLLASGTQLRSPLRRIDTTQATADHVELQVAPCQRFGGAVEQQTGERWSDRGPAPGAAIELAGVAIGTTDRDGKFEVCAADEDELVVRAAGFAPVPWRRVMSWSRRGELPVTATRDEVVTGTVFEADGAPAANVGVQPIWGSLQRPTDCVEAPLVVTSDRDGRFAFAGDRRICGLRIYRGAVMYEAPLTAVPLSLLPIQPPPPPMWWLDNPAPPAPPEGPVRSVVPIKIGPGSRAQLIVRLADPIRDPVAGFVAARARMRGAAGTWLHVRVTHAGAPVLDAGVVVSHSAEAEYDEWTQLVLRRDGSSDAYVMDRAHGGAPDGHLVIEAEDRSHHWTGHAELESGAEERSSGEREVTIELDGTRTGG